MRKSFYNLFEEDFNSDSSRPTPLISSIYFIPIFATFQFHNYLRDVLLFYTFSETFNVNPGSPAPAFEPAVKFDALFSKEFRSVIRICKDVLHYYYFI